MRWSIVTSPRFQPGVIDGKVAALYGVFNEKEGTSERANIIIDENGKIVFVKIYPGPELPDIEEIIKVIEDMEPE